MLYYCYGLFAQALKNSILNRTLCSTVFTEKNHIIRRIKMNKNNSGSTKTLASFFADRKKDGSEHQSFFEWYDSHKSTIFVAFCSMIFGAILCSICMIYTFNDFVAHSGDGLHYYSDKTYDSIEEAVSTYSEEDVGIDSLSLQAEMNELTSHYNGNTTTVTCVKKAGSFEAVVEAVFEANYKFVSFSRNFNSFQEYATHYWKNCRAYVIGAALIVFLVAIIALYIVFKFFVFVARKIYNRCKAKVSPECSTI